MPLPRLWGRPERPAAGLRTRMSVLALEDRAAPSSLLATEDERQDVTAWDATAAYLSTSGGQTGGMTVVPEEEEADPIDLPPEIVDFAVTPVGSGGYQFSGRVIDEAPGGLVVTFGGIPSAEGQTATTGGDGSFSLTIQLRTDGSDVGLATAVTQDGAGQSSNVATYWVDPR